MVASTIVEDFDASTQRTVAHSTNFTYEDRGPGESRIGHYDRDTGFFAALRGIGGRRDDRLGHRAPLHNSIHNSTAAHLHASKGKDAACRSRDLPEASAGIVGAAPPASAAGSARGTTWTTIMSTTDAPRPPRAGIVSTGDGGTIKTSTPRPANPLRAAMASGVPSSEA